MSAHTRGDTRDRILIAAATMLGEDPTARLSVRAVAARAGVSTGSLRHFFPTQRALLDAVIAGLYEVELPDDPMADADASPTDRLVTCLQLLLAEAGAGEQARKLWRHLHDAYIATSATDDDAHAYLALERLGIRRLERWLEQLAAEGAVDETEIAHHARFLGTVVNGLVAERALPGARARLELEPRTLRTAAEAVVARDR